MKIFCLNMNSAATDRNNDNNYYGLTLENNGETHNGVSDFLKWNEIVKRFNYVIECTLTGEICGLT